jgi:phytoene synthase
MEDAFAYCAELVRTADRDRFLASLFAPVQHRDALYALYAFNVEVSRVREVAHEPLPGEIRLQWWSEVVNGERGEEARANPVAAALLAVIERYSLAPSKMIALIDARRFDLYNEPMMRLADLEAYARKTSSALIALTVRILAGVDAQEVADTLGIAAAVVALLRALPLHAARGQLYVPIEVLDRHGVQVQDVLAGRSSDGLNTAVAELRNHARGLLVAARKQTTALPSEAWPAFLPVALVGPSLDRLERCDAFSPVELPPWRRQWLIWRAASNPVRIAG